MLTLTVLTYIRHSRMIERHLDESALGRLGFILHDVVDALLT